MQGLLITDRSSSSSPDQDGTRIIRVTWDRLSRAPHVSVVTIDQKTRTTNKERRLACPAAAACDGRGAGTGQRRGRGRQEWPAFYYRHTALLCALLPGLTAGLCALLPGLTALCTGGEMADCSTHTGGMEAEPGGGFSLCGAMSTPPATGWCSPSIRSSLRYELSPPVQVGETQPALYHPIEKETLSRHRFFHSSLFLMTAFVFSWLGNLSADQLIAN